MSDVVPCDRRGLLRIDRVRAWLTDVWIDGPGHGKGVGFHSLIRPERCMERVSAEAAALLRAQS